MYSQCNADGVVWDTPETIYIFSTSFACTIKHVIKKEKEEHELFSLRQEQEFEARYSELLGFRLVADIMAHLCFAITHSEHGMDMYSGLEKGAISLAAFAEEANSIHARGEPQVEPLRVPAACSPIRRSRCCCRPLPCDVCQRPASRWRSRPSSTTTLSPRCAHLCSLLRAFDCSQSAPTPAYLPHPHSAFILSDPSPLSFLRKHVSSTPPSHGTSAHTLLLNKKKTILHPLPSLPHQKRNPAVTNPEIPRPNRTLDHPLANRPASAPRCAFTPDSSPRRSCSPSRRSNLADNGRPQGPTARPAHLPSAPVSSTPRRRRWCRRGRRGSCGWVRQRHGAMSTGMWMWRPTSTSSILRTWNGWSMRRDPDGWVPMRQTDRGTA